MNKQNKNNKDTRVLMFSVPAGILMANASFAGLFGPVLYEQELFSWKVQCFSQDTVNLIVILPFLAFTSVFAYLRNFYGTLLWAGTMLYLAYTYMIYCVGIHFGPMFLNYCAILGLSFYAVLYFLISWNNTLFNINNSKTLRASAIYLITIAVIFGFLWLSEIIPAVNLGFIPKSISDSGLFTNPVHVLDLSVTLPGLLFTGILILKKNRLGILLTPVILSFCLLMNITIGLLNVMMRFSGINTNITVALVMGALCLLCLTLLITNYKSIKQVSI